MEVFGISAYHATIIIVIIGVGLHVILGIIRSHDKINPRKIASSAIIATISGLIIIGPQVSVLPEDLSDTVLLSSIVSMIAAVAGIDALTKKAVHIERGRRETVKDIELEIEKLKVKKEKLEKKSKTDTT